MLKYKKSSNKTGPDSTDPFVLQNGRWSGSKIDAVYRASWSENAFISDNSAKETLGLSFNFSLLTLASLAVSILLLLLMAKTAWLQVLNGDYYYSLAENNRVRNMRIEPKRGVIYDRNMLPLVQNQANFLLYAVPADLSEDKAELLSVLDEIAGLLNGFDPEAAMSKILAVNRYSLEAYRPLFLADNIDYEPAISLHLKCDDWPGFVMTNKIRREYLTYAFDPDIAKKPFTFSMSHILGYTGKISSQELEAYGNEYSPIDYIGKSGIEYFWENELKGESGRKSIEVDAWGKEKKILREEPARDGHNLVLSVDARVQVKLEEILLSHLEKRAKARASAVVMDPRNGEVIALVSLPAYDNNSFARGISSAEYDILMNHPDKPLFNRAVGGEYSSGSTIKPMMAAAALQEKIINENTSFLSTGGISVGQWHFPDWRAGGHGRTDVRRAIAESVNTFFYYIGGGYENFSGLGVDRIGEYARSFGFGAQTGIDLSGEASGFVPSREWKEQARGERWYIGNTYHLSIGQGDFLSTPLQIAAMTQVFANGGKLFRPHFVREILTGSDQSIRTVRDEPVRQGFIDDHNIRVVRSGMRQTVSSGSARSLASLPVAVAGKTGTAQWSSRNSPHAWFAGFAPYDDPEMVITILVEEGGEGSEVAVPVAKEFWEWYYGEE